MEIEKRITILKNLGRNFKLYSITPKIYRSWGIMRLTFSRKNFEIPFSRSHANALLVSAFHSYHLILQQLSCKGPSYMTFSKPFEAWIFWKKSTALHTFGKNLGKVSSGNTYFFEVKVQEYICYQYFRAL